MVELSRISYKHICKTIIGHCFAAMCVLFNLILFNLVLFNLTACSSGGGAGRDALPTYSLSTNTTIIDSTNESHFAFRVATQPTAINHRYTYTFTDTQNFNVSGVGTVTADTFTVDNIDLSALASGDITLHFTADDNQNNTVTANPLTLNKNSTANRVSISGRMTYDFVPHNANGGLNYTATSAAPARHVIVKLLDANDDEISETITDDNGEYMLESSLNINARIRVEAIFRPANASANNTFNVKDNTRDDALYVIQGELINTGESDSTRNLHADSGWDDSGYSSPRSAAPFAILDALYEAVTLNLSVAPDTEFPSLDIFWSPRNSSALGDDNDGDIASSKYLESSGIFVLGAANNDADEYDRHVIIHEFGHFFEKTLSRSDSMGGSHTSNDFLDMRVAFSEGWGNAYSAMVLNDPIYKDSTGFSQNQGFSFNVETPDNTHRGWYNEDSVASILYDIYDQNNEDEDNINDGFGSIYHTLTSNTFKQSPLIVGSHVFFHTMKELFPAIASDIDALTAAQNILVNEASGSSETNNANVVEALPIFEPVVVGGGSVRSCSISTFGIFNKLSNRRYFPFSLSSAGSYTITITTVSGSAESDPDLLLWMNGSEIMQSNVINPSQEVWQGELSPGEYVIEAFDYANLDGMGANLCFDIHING